LLAAEEEALMGSSDEDGEDGDEPDFGDGQPDFDLDEIPEDDNDEYLGEPSEDQLESLLLDDEEFMDEVDDFEENGAADGDSSAFAAAEEYAELLEDNDLPEDKIRYYREKARLSKGAKKKALSKGSGGQDQKQLLGKKRKQPPSKKQTAKRKKKF
jgi:hypothetical protein